MTERIKVVREERRKYKERNEESVIRKKKETEQ